MPLRRTQIQRKVPLRSAKPERFFCHDCGAERPGSTCDSCGSSGLPPVLTAKPVIRPKPPADAIPERVREQLAERSNGVCERCYQARAAHAHHIQLRRGGDHSLGNLAHLCAPCHAFVHANPVRARVEGFLRSQWGGDAA